MLSTIIKSQPPLCEGKPAGSVWSAKCCKCKINCVLIDDKPRMPGDCRHCQLLCVECRAEMGDLNKALEDLKQKNRDLNKQYQKIDDDLLKSNNKFYEAVNKITGERENTEGWNLDGLNGSMGKFSVALLSLASDFTGSGATKTLIDKKWFGTGLTLATNGIGIYQMYTGPKGEFKNVSDAADALSDYGGLFSDFLTLEFNQAAMLEIVMDDEDYIYKQMRNGRPLENILKGLDYPFSYENLIHTSPDNLTNSQFEKIIKGLEKFSLLADIWALEQATTSLTSDLTDLLFFWGHSFGIEKVLENILAEILKNNELMACIRETQEFLKKGPGTRIMNNAVSRDMAINFITPSILSSYHQMLIPNITYDFAEINFTVDEVKIKSAISRIKQIRTLEFQILSILYGKVFPSFIPWINNGWKKLKPGILIQLLQKTKAPFQEMIRKCDEMTRLYQSIKSDLQYAVIFEKQISDGSDNIQNSPLSEYTDGFYLIENQPGTSGTEKWSLASNKKIPAGKGRLNLVFPANVDWSVDIYTADNKFYVNRSSYSKHGSYVLAPGNYHFKLNSIPVDNVVVETGKETRFKTGIFNVISRGHWELYDESKKTYYTSRNKPVKLVLPVGTYMFNFEKKDYRIQIKDGVILKFESRKPLFVDQ